MDVLAAQTHILLRLRQELAPDLSYHSVFHTLDVCATVREIGLAEGVSDEELQLLHTAALFHDTGFLYTYQGHEAVSCDIAKQALPTFGYTPQQIEAICRLIMATQVPQQPHSHLEQIICDADLAYLGRDDFFPVAHQLFLEFRSRGVVENEEEWNQLQIRFLLSHQYFTQTARRLRAARKASHLAQLQAETPSLAHS